MGPSNVKLVIIPVVTIALITLVVTNGLSTTFLSTASATNLTSTYAGVDIDTSSGEYACNGSTQKGKINSLVVDAYNRHGKLTGQWTLINEIGSEEDTVGSVTGGQISASSFNLAGKTDRDMICPTIYDDILITGQCGENKTIEMKTPEGKTFATLNGNARCYNTLNN
jgi:hypothetical protein